ncbi:MAG: hypothetical protein U0V74_08170 [Chitinophagales bacterium]
MGRPPTLPAQLRDGFYIDVRSKTADKGVKIRAESEEEMMANANIYKNSKEVTILGQLKKGVWLNELANAEKKAKDKAAAKAAAKEKAAPAKEVPVKKAAAAPVAKKPEVKKPEVKKPEVKKAAAKKPAPAKAAKAKAPVKKKK